MSTLLIIIISVWFILGFSIALIAGIDCYRHQVTFTFSDLCMCLSLICGGIFSFLAAISEMAKLDFPILKKKK